MGRAGDTEKRCGSGLSRVHCHLGVGEFAPGGSGARMRGVRLGPAVTAQLLHSKRGPLFPSSLEALYNTKIQCCCQLSWPELLLLKDISGRYLCRPVGWPFLPHQGPHHGSGGSALKCPEVILPPLHTELRHSAASCRRRLAPELPGEE